MRASTILSAVVAVAAWPTSAWAFCGFYVAEAEVELGNDTSFVVLVRDGTTTVMTMRNDYVGPAEDFAMVIPLPSPVDRDDVHVLNESVLERLDRLTSPRLVEYWEREPYCPSPGMRGRRARIPRIRAGAAGVRVETSFAVGEYDFVVLGADDSTSLETWLRDEGYRIPERAAPLLRPYVQNGYRFLVAKVDAARVSFDGDAALLSPIRVAYESPRLELPLRLGLANSRGVQDVAAVVIARNQRFDVANRPNVFVPTNLVVRPSARERFGELYAAVLDRTFENNPGAAVTEYVWDTTGCDPCTGPTMTAGDLNLLGGDVISGTVEERTASRSRVRFHRLTRAEGTGHSEEAVGELLDRRGTELSRCYVGYADVAIDAKLSFGTDGALRQLTIPSRSPVDEACVARVFRRARITRPPLLTGDSRWDVRLSFEADRVRRQPSAAGFTATRIRLRVKPGGEARDVVFREARPVSGGRGEPTSEGRLDDRVVAAPSNTFQPRFAVLHRFRGDVACRHPEHTGWSGYPPRHRRRYAATRDTGDPIADLVVDAPEWLRPLRPRRVGRLSSSPPRSDPSLDRALVAIPTRQRRSI